MSIKPSVFIAVPIHRAWSHESQDYLMQNIQAAKSWRLGVLFKLYEESLIQRARQTCLDAFLKSRDDFLFFMDDDVVLIEPDSIDRLVASGKEIIGAIHVCKKPPHRPTFLALKGVDNFPDLRQVKEPFEVRYCGTGSLLISRNAARAIRGMYKYPFECFEASDGVYLSEDWAFCHRAKQLHFPIYVHPAIVTGHIGTYAYSISDYYAYLETQGRKTT